MGARLADSLDQPVWRQYLRQDLRRLAGLIIKVERHPAAAMPGEEAADRRVILRPVADEDRDVICLERLRHLLPLQRHLFVHLAGDAPVGRKIDEHRLFLGPERRQPPLAERSEEHTSELQSLMRISYAVFRS